MAIIYTGDVSIFSNLWRTYDACEPVTVRSEPSQVLFQSRAGITLLLNTVISGTHPLRARHQSAPRKSFCPFSAAYARKCLTSIFSWTTLLVWAICQKFHRNLRPIGPVNEGVSAILYELTNKLSLLKEGRPHQLPGFRSLWPGAVIELYIDACACLL